MCYEKGPSPKAFEALAQSLGESHLYPDAGCYYLKEALLKRHANHGIANENLVLANGTNEIISMLVRVFIGPDEALLNAWPSFVCYRLAARSSGIEEATIPLTEDYAYDLPKMAEYAQSPQGRPVKMVFVGNPNNPTGRYIPKAELDLPFPLPVSTSSTPCSRSALAIEASMTLFFRCMRCLCFCSESFISRGVVIGH